MNESTITVSLTLAQRELILDLINDWIVSDPEDKPEYLQSAIELEDLLGPIPAE